MRKGDDLTTFMVSKVEKIRSFNLPDSQGPSQACSGKKLPLPILVCMHLSAYVILKVFSWNIVWEVYATQSR